jgi:hypothetical protein
MKRTLSLLLNGHPEQASGFTKSGHEPSYVAERIGGSTLGSVAIYLADRSAILTNDMFLRSFFPSCHFFQHSLYYNHGYGKSEYLLRDLLVYLTEEEDAQWNMHQRRP